MGAPPPAWAARSSLCWRLPGRLWSGPTLEWGLGTGLSAQVLRMFPFSLPSVCVCPLVFAPPPSLNTPMRLSLQTRARQLFGLTFYHF